MPKKIKHIKSLILALALVLFSLSTNAQELNFRVIDNKGTIQDITVKNNTVTTTTTNTPPANPVEDDLWFNTSTSPTTISVWDGTAWLAISGNNFWSLTGNSDTNPTTNFVGTTDAQDLVLRAGNVEKIRLNNAVGQVLVNRATAFNAHPLVIRANTNDVLAFEDENGTPQWHWNLLGNGLNFVESNELFGDYRLFLENGGNVGINTSDPTERLDIEGKLRIRDIATVTTNNDILTTDANGVVQKKRLIAAETDNLITAGANGGVYLSSTATVYTGHFIIDNTSPLTITGIPFSPSQITFVAHANIESFGINSDNGLGDNHAGIANSFGTMNGYARNNAGGTISQAVIYVGGSGRSINDISRYSNDAQCIGVRYGDQNGNNLGVISASLTSFNANGFTINISKTLGATSENLIVLYTAYR